MRNAHGKIGLVWKILLVVGVLGVLAIGGIIYLGTTMVKLDRPSIERIADSIVTFKEPLPDKFKYHLGMDIGPMKLAALDCPESDQEIFIGRIATKASDNDPKKLVERIGASSGKTGTSFTVQHEGTLKAGGEDIQYATGTSSARSKSTAETPAFIGFCPRNASGQTVFIYGGQKSGTTFDMKPIQTILDDVVSFK